MFFVGYDSCPITFFGLGLSPTLECDFGIFLPLLIWGPLVLSDREFFPPPQSMEIPDFFLFALSFYSLILSFDECSPSTDYILLLSWFSCSYLSMTVVTFCPIYLFINNNIHKRKERGFGVLGTSLHRETQPKIVKKGSIFPLAAPLRDTARRCTETPNRKL